MKILYGVQGTGNGHIARARVMAKAFAQRSDVEVDFLFSGRDEKNYFDMQPFGNCRYLQGLTFVTQQGEVKKWQTLRSLKLSNFVREVRSLRLHDYDLLLNDFEPVTAWAARLAQIPSIAVSHQAALNNKIPKSGETLWHRLLMKYFAPCDVNLGVHWYHFGCPIMPPFIDILGDPTEAGDTVVVYLPFESREAIESLLTQTPQQRYECYHPNIEEDTEFANIVWRKPSKQGFEKALLGCKGVIASGGFELSSECLQLGKKLLIKPLKGQYEQDSNRLVLEKMQRCMSMDSLDADTVAKWLLQESPAPIQYPNCPDTFIDWILDENWDDTKSLCTELWKQTQIPASMQKALAI